VWIIKSNVVFTARKYLDPILAEKAKEMNVSADKGLAEKWEKMELYNFKLDLVPRSYRDGRNNFDFCVNTGWNI